MDIIKLRTLTDEELLEKLVELNKKIKATHYLGSSRDLEDALQRIADAIYMEMDVRAMEAMTNEFVENSSDIIEGDKGWGVKEEKTSRFSNVAKNQTNKPGTPKIFQKTFKKK